MLLMHTCTGTHPHAHTTPCISLSGDDLANIHIMENNLQVNLHMASAVPHWLNKQRQGGFAACTVCVYVCVGECV